MTISLIIPCYNEEINIQKGVLDKIGNYAQSKPEFLEVIIVDDGSTDGSKEIIKQEYLSRFKKFKLVENQHQGKAQAIIKGILGSSGDYVMFSDIDLATPIEEAVKLEAEAKRGNKIIIGSRQVRRQGAPFLRKLQSVGLIVVRDVFLQMRGIRDTQCGFKMFEKNAALLILERLRVFKKAGGVKGSSVSAGFDLEFLFLAIKMGYIVREVPVQWRHVETKNVHFIKDTIETLKDVFAIKMNDMRGNYHKAIYQKSLSE